MVVIIFCPTPPPLPPSVAILRGFFFNIDFKHYLSCFTFYFIFKNYMTLKTIKKVSIRSWQFNRKKSKIKKILKRCAMHKRICLCISDVRDTERYVNRALDVKLTHSYLQRVRKLHKFSTKGHIKQSAMFI